jgi:hypothetical protein
MEKIEKINSITPIAAFQIYLEAARPEIQGRAWRKSSNARGLGGAGE